MNKDDILIFPGKHFSRALVLDLGYEPLKSQSKIRMSSFVHPSQIPCSEQKIAQFRDHLREYGLGTHFGQHCTKYFKSLSYSQPQEK